MTYLISPDDRIYVAGHRGMAGSAICRALNRSGYSSCYGNRSELNLLDAAAVEQWFAKNDPTVVCGCKSWRYTSQQHVSH